MQRQKRELRQRAIEALSQKTPAQTKVRWSSLTREERRREASRQRYHASFRENPEAIRQRRQQYRKAHAEEINRNQREYRKANAAELNAKRREYRRERAQVATRRGPQLRNLQVERSAEPLSSLVSTPLTPEASARSWLASREKSGPGISAEQSAQVWKAHSQRQPTGPTAEEAAPDWLAHSEGRASQERDHAPAKDSSRDPHPGTTGEADDDDQRKIDRRRDYDLEL